jgi:hypothetical protein
MGFFDCEAATGSWKCIDKIDSASSVALPYCPTTKYPSWSGLGSSGVVIG